jgi:hypothetical protein
MGNKKSRKSKIVVILLSLFVVVILAGIGYSGAKQWWIKNQPRSSLSTVKIEADVLSWSFRYVPEIYFKIVALDDMIALLESELDRLKELAKKYPDQKNIVSEEKARLETKKEELIGILTHAGKATETMYVAYKIDVRKGHNQIGSKETYELGKKLTSTLKSSSRLANRIKSQNPEKWTDKISKMF